MRGSEYFPPARKTVPAVNRKLPGLNNSHPQGKSSLAD
jgi:hypothetical protein